MLIPGRLVGVDGLGSGSGRSRFWFARGRRTDLRSVRKLESSMRIAALAGLAGLIALASPALALDKVTFATNWLADPEAGGYFQAVVDGTYAKYGLDVTIMQGGPQSNGGMLLIAGKIEFFMGGDMIGDFLSVEQNIPTIAVAADFQKDRQIFLSHPGRSE